MSDEQEAIERVKETSRLITHKNKVIELAKPKAFAGNWWTVKGTSLAGC